MQGLFEKVSRVPVCCLVLAGGLLLESRAQITSSGYASVIQSEYSLEYPDTVLQDNIYLFCDQTGNLSATLVGVQGTLDFEWSLYDPAVPGFDIPAGSDRGMSSSLTGLESGGYQVRITDGNGVDTLFRAWLFVNRPLASVSVARHDCQVIDLLGSVGIDTFIYYHPESHEPFTVPGDYSFAWSADPFVPVSSTRLDPRIWSQPPVVTDYTLTVNYHGCQASHTITEDPVTTRAEFELVPGEGEAPLEVQFDAGRSLNAQKYEWFFEYRQGDEETGIPDGHTADPLHTYYIPGEYNVGLRTISAYLCESFFVHPETVSIYFSMLEVPNVFSPDDDAFNEAFRVSALSLRDFRAVVYNRYGRKVYESTDPSEVWDGTVDGSLASPGVYFYVITAVGWDEREYEFTGPLHLYRVR